MPALIASLLLLSILVTATVLTSVLYVHPRGVPTHSTTTITAVTVSRIVTTVISKTTTSSSLTTSSSSSSITSKTTTTTTSSNKTSLVVRIMFPNGSSFNAGVLYADSLSANSSDSGEYLFPKINPGTYSLSIRGPNNVYLPPTSLQLSSGLNYANITIYSLHTFVLYFTNGISINGTQPGPSIIVHNASAVRFVLINNTTLIHNLAVVMTLGNESSENILFNSLSYTLNAGGSTNSTFIATMPGDFYYADLIGNHASLGDYGHFYVISP